MTDDCIACGICVTVCPVDAVDEDNGYGTLDDICIHCCACIKACPQSARIMKDGPFKEIAARLNQTWGSARSRRHFLPAGNDNRDRYTVLKCFFELTKNQLQLIVY